MNIILAIIILGFLVAIHEFGHFVVAKISGMYVTTFSIGMGPKIASFQKGETEYVISAIPAGGFVSVKGITGDPEIDDDPDDPRLFQNRPILHRMLFTVAGPFMNFLTALVALPREIVGPLVDQPHRAYYDAYQAINVRLDAMAEGCAALLRTHGYQATANTEEHLPTGAEDRSPLPHKAGSHK